jgi:hypothetical protein
LTDQEWVKIHTFRATSVEAEDECVAHVIGLQVRTYCGHVSRLISLALV